MSLIGTVDVLRAALGMHVRRPRLRWSGPRDARRVALRRREFAGPGDIRLAEAARPVEARDAPSGRARERDVGIVPTAAEATPELTAGVSAPAIPPADGNTRST